jgi:hypothetical protein
VVAGELAPVQLMSWETAPVEMRKPKASGAFRAVAGGKSDADEHDAGDEIQSSGKQRELQEDQDTADRRQNQTLRRG